MTDLMAVRFLYLPHRPPLTPRTRTVLILSSVIWHFPSQASTARPSPTSLSAFSSRHHPSSGTDGDRSLPLQVNNVRESGRLRILAARPPARAAIDRLPLCRHA